MRMEKKEGACEEITIFGFTKSVYIMLISLISFVGLCFVSVEVLFNTIYSTPMKAMVISITGFALFSAVYGVQRFFAEQVITYVTANFYAINSLTLMEEEEKEEDREESNTGKE